MKTNRLKWDILNYKHGRYFFMIKYKTSVLARVATKNENRTRLNEPLRNGKNGRLIFDHEKISTILITII